MSAHPAFGSVLSHFGGQSTQTDAAIARIQQLEKTNRELEARLSSEEGENRQLREQVRVLRAFRPDVLIGDFTLEVETHSATFHAPVETGDVTVDPEDVLEALNALAQKHMPELEADVYARWKKRAKA